LTTICRWTPYRRPSIVWAFLLKSGSYNRVAPSREQWLLLSVHGISAQGPFLSFFLSQATIRISPWSFSIRSETEALRSTGLERWRWNGYDQEDAQECVVDRRSDEALPHQGYSWDSQYAPRIGFEIGDKKSSIFDRDVLEIHRSDVVSSSSV